MIALIAFFGFAGLAVGFLLGKATQYNNAREKLRLHVIQSNLDHLTIQQIDDLLNQL